MSSSGKQESDEFRLVSLPYAGADPWTVMVVYFDADPTIWAVKGARWSYQLAGITIRKFVIVLVALQILRGTVNVETGVKELKLVNIVEFCCRGLLRD